LAESLNCILCLFLLLSFRNKKWDELERLRDEVQDLYESDSTKHKWTRIKTRLEKILELNPTDKIALYHLGVFWYRIGLDEKALTFFEKVIKLDENHMNALFFKGMILIDMEKDKEAIKYFDKIMLMHEPPDETWFNKGVALQNSGKFAEALKHYDQYLNFDEENQNDADALLNKSAVLLALGKNDEAITFYDRAVSLDESLRKTMERPKPKMRLWKRILRRLAIGFGFLVVFHLIIQLLRYLM